MFKCVGRKISRGRARGKKTKNSTIKPLSGGSLKKKSPKNSKKDQK